MKKKKKCVSTVYLVLPIHSLVSLCLLRRMIAKEKTEGRGGIRGGGIERGEKTEKRKSKGEKMCHLLTFSLVLPFHSLVSLCLLRGIHVTLVVPHWLQEAVVRKLSYKYFHCDMQQLNTKRKI